jgi:4-diphosphocytidyl-2-C-methyl-D-erythritol kinase
VNLVAPAKVNLCLYVGPTREDGLHELCSLFAPIGLADRLRCAAADEDRVVVPAELGPEPDLTARALAALREAGVRWPDGTGAVRIEVEKSIPVAAGLGGGSADAAAVLRSAAGELPDGRIEEIARSLGADVASQLDPRFCLVGGAGEEMVDLPPPAPFPVVLVPDPEGLSTAAVYAEADRLGSIRSAGELRELRGLLLAAAASGRHPLDYRDLLVNDLAPAAISLRPALAGTLAAIEQAGAELAIVTGSGPTAVGICTDRRQADTVASALTATYPTISVDAGRP